MLSEAATRAICFDRCWLTGEVIGLTAVNTAAHLLDLPYCLTSTVRDCEFQHAQTGVRGCHFISGSPGTYFFSNAIQIENCTFRDLDSVAISSAGEAWQISGCTFQQRLDNTAGAYRQDSGTHALGLVISACWFGDVQADGGCWVSFADSSAYGVSIVGNRFGAPGNGTADACIRLGADMNGISISGNIMEGPIGIDFLNHTMYGISITGNHLNNAILQPSPLPNLPGIPIKDYTLANPLLIAGNTNI